MITIKTIMRLPLLTLIALSTTHSVNALTVPTLPKINVEAATQLIKNHSYIAGAAAVATTLVVCKYAYNKMFRKPAPFIRQMTSETGIMGKDGKVVWRPMTDKEKADFEKRMKQVDVHMEHFNKRFDEGMQLFAQGELEAREGKFYNDFFDRFRSFGF